MASDRLTVTEVARRFSDVVNRVYYQRQTFLLTRGGTVVAKLTTADREPTGAELARSWRERPRLDPGDADAWADELAALKVSVPQPEEARWDS